MKLMSETAQVFMHLVRLPSTFSSNRLRFGRPHAHNQDSLVAFGGKT